MRIRRGLFIAVLASTVVAGGNAGATIDPDAEQWTTTKLPHSTIVVRYPKQWKNKAQGHGIIAVDPTNADNLFAIEPGKSGWFNDLAAYEARIGQTAALRGGTVLDASETTFGTKPAYRSVAELNGPRRLLSGDMQIRLGKRRIVLIEVTVDPGERDVVDAIFDSVRVG